MSAGPLPIDRIRLKRDTDGTVFTLERVAPDTVSVVADERPIGRVPVSTTFPPLNRLLREEKLDLVDRALARTAIGRWEGEGGAEATPGD